MKTSELTGAALDWAVAQCRGLRLNGPYACFDGAWCIQEPDGSDGDVCPSYSTDCDHGGPIIEREKIATRSMWVDAKEIWIAYKPAPLGAHQNEFSHYGETALIAAMRCFVASKLGEEVDVPEGQE